MRNGRIQICAWCCHGLNWGRGGAIVYQMLEGDIIGLMWYQYCAVWDSKIIGADLLANIFGWLYLMGGPIFVGPTFGTVLMEVCYKCWGL